MIILEINRVHSIEFFSITIMPDVFYYLSINAVLFRFGLSFNFISRPEA